MILKNAKEILTTIGVKNPAAEIGAIIESNDLEIAVGATSQFFTAKK